jgi:hypothetical protein
VYVDSRLTVGEDGVCSGSALRACPFGWTRTDTVLGRGSFGTVYLGLTDHGELVAVKEVPIAPLHTVSDSQKGGVIYSVIV